MSRSLIAALQSLSSSLWGGQPDAALCRPQISRWFMAPFETIYIDTPVAVCNGGEGPLGHPRVYLNLAPSGKVECPYCSRLFVNRAMSVPAGEPAPPGDPPLEPAQRRDTRK
jgi:uncharacterized Zn-finger protein